MNRNHFTKYLQNTTLLNHDSLEQLRILTTESPWFQAGWILYLKNLKAVDSPQFEEVLKKVAVMVPDRKQLYKFLNDEIQFSVETTENEQMSGYSLDNNSSEGHQGNALIDRFLNSGAGNSIRANQRTQLTESAVNKDILEKSVIENDELVTETLANIYFHQKNYEKAIKAFKKLSLKYPEKNIYFASRIKEIEVIKNNT
ncbi:tetratricopeptide repeat protein [Maribellus sp. YY47]|uniref:tetratricopeptide repeat protein n=1 Tax=Maribellus sp. YY47 TaxID=2929486 RepID=UPI002001C17F|nr:tetratricopeptide repeat protein [Maribellus sp. YY47]MCK3685909.1 tetratricopeptide repeat protein [Maribellus sp. YY47]